MNRAYSPVIQVNKLAHQTFKPRGGELATKKGTALIKKGVERRVLKGKVSPKPGLERGERELLRILEEGTEFGSGVGKITQPTERIAKKLAGRQVAKVKTKEAITKAGKLKAERIGREFDIKIGVLERGDRRVAKVLRQRDVRRKIRNAVVGGGIALGVVVNTIRNCVGAGGRVAEIIEAK